ncbi:MAG: pyruvate, water dikinase [Thermogemmatispora sp.]|uniref:Phosphoenolpyruvate synthase n=1 Tax=Thermogemmatispora tikiterensis TaxID=1825093 RepID=A0A328VPK5_9CHLR|nr:MULTISPECIES: PEP/pyruvate-binding domain-containing protein [Thermogemmatispora]MBX5457707.1 pyruvate, water dikinase [Thermogemmatispora sp.]RAQ97613.1 pyruvate, water dikinase [Thermogemmatispora tikiterensis]
MRQQVQQGAILWFDEAACCDVRQAGGKGASLATMTAQGLPVPPGFVIPASILEQSVERERLLELTLAQRHAEAQALVRQAEPPRAAISAAYERLAPGNGLVAVRSSACAEDSEAASYAGQQETYLNVRGAEEVCRRVVDCWASFFSERAIFYRARKGSLHDLGMAVVVQKMLAPEKSGVLFTVDPVNRRRDRLIIEAVFGLGEQVVSGEVTPDHYVVDRAGTIKREQIVGAQRVLEPEEIRRLTELGLHLMELFGQPQDIEWAIEHGQLYLLQSRPITTL